MCYYASNDIVYLNNLMNQASKLFHDWCVQNRLTLNLSKCKAMVISGSTQKKIKELKKEVNISIENVPIETVCE